VVEVPEPEREREEQEAGEREARTCLASLVTGWGLRP
jgi:hypothetical protein